MKATFPRSLSSPTATLTGLACALVLALTLAPGASAKPPSRHHRHQVAHPVRVNHLGGRDNRVKDTSVDRTTGARDNSPDPAAGLKDTSVDRTTGARDNSPDRSPAGAGSPDHSQSGDSRPEASGSRPGVQSGPDNSPDSAAQRG